MNQTAAAARDTTQPVLKSPIKPTINANYATDYKNNPKTVSYLDATIGFMITQTHINELSAKMRGRRAGLHA